MSPNGFCPDKAEKEGGGLAGNFVLCVSAHFNQSRFADLCVVISDAVKSFKYDGISHLFSWGGLI